MVLKVLDAEAADRPVVSLHPVPNDDGLIVKVEPPRIPPAALGLKRTPCDIVLVIDVSGSMASNAPAPTSNAAGQEDTGLSVLDLTKHAARTILETLDEGDRLGLVTYSTDANILQGLEVMTKKAKVLTRKRIDSMVPLNSTNMWHGILRGLDLFKAQDETENQPAERVPALMLLTDGMPNHMCPPQGYIPKLRSMEALPARIHTFGFGYSLRSDLLSSIAEVAGGNYSFIADAGMIGTVFVHAVANLQSTYAHDATLVLKYPDHLEIAETTGDTVVTQEPYTVDPSTTGTRISLGHVIYGQSRDVYLKVKTKSPGRQVSDAQVNITVDLHYSRVGAQPATESAESSYNDAMQLLSSAEVDYHKSRSELCAFLSELAANHHLKEDIAKDTAQDLRDLVTAVKGRLVRHGDPLNQSIADDIFGKDPQGQVSLAVSKSSYWNTWGRHYLPSLLHAHWRQACNSFKDPGPLQYGAHSPLFIQCRDALDTAFDSIPAPKPSNRPSQRSGGGWSAPIRMSMYNNANAPCFAGSTPVKLSTGRSVPIRSLRRGSEVLSPLGPRRVAAVLVTPVSREILCRVGDLLVTPWHPVSLDGGKGWAFPAQVADSAVRYTGCVYSVLLQPDRISTAHAIHVGGVWGVTLGHGVLAGRDVRAHSFFGDFGAVVKSLRYIGVRRNGLAVGGGIRRDEKTGLVTGFRRGTGRLPGSMADVKVSSGLAA